MQHISHITYITYTSILYPYTSPRKPFQAAFPSSFNSNSNSNFPLLFIYPSLHLASSSTLLIYSPPYLTPTPIQRFVPYYNTLYISSFTAVISHRG